MKIYKKFNTDKNRQYNRLAEEYLKANNIKCKYYAWLGMAGDNDIIIADNNTYRFNINTKERVK